MKKRLKIAVFICIFFCSINFAKSQQKFYYAFEEKIFLNEVENKIALSLGKKYFCIFKINTKFYRANAYKFSKKSGY